MNTLQYADDPEEMITQLRDIMHVIARRLAMPQDRNSRYIEQIIIGFTDVDDWRPPAYDDAEDGY